jgi:mono/diheme cytochrome c family protein
MNKILKRILITLGVLVVVAFLAFLYLIPPFMLLPREAFVEPYKATVAASLQQIENPTERLLAERGRYIVARSACNDCHTPVGDKGPIFEKFLAGGNKSSWKRVGVTYSRNLTPDKETGLARYTDEQVLDVWHYGLNAQGRQFEFTFMPWADFSNWTEEDKHAVLVYLRHIKAVKHDIPELDPLSNDPFNSFYAGDYAKH